jgi:hypothetical protein
MAQRTPERIDVPFPDGDHPELTLAIGACRLEVGPGGGPAWVDGSYDDASGALPWTLRRDADGVRISQGLDVKGTLGLLSAGLPRFALALGRAKPFRLAVQGGGSDVALDLGGVPLEELSLQQGAGRLRCTFSAPNPVPMSRLDVDAGAVSLELASLGNAGFSRMRLEGGAASYDLDFSGALARDAEVTIGIGMSNVRIAVPATTAAKIVPEPILGALDVGDGLTKREGAFWTEAAIRGGTPVLAIRANVTLGALRIAVI